MTDRTHPDNLKQLNMRDPRVERWYDQVANHSDSGRCKNDDTCPGCKALEFRRRQLRAMPGLLA